MKLSEKVFLWSLGLLAVMLPSCSSDEPDTSVPIEHFQCSRIPYEELEPGFEDIPIVTIAFSESTQKLTVKIVNYDIEGIIDKVKPSAFISGNSISLCFWQPRYDPRLEASYRTKTEWVLDNIAPGSYSVSIHYIIRNSPPSEKNLDSPLMKDSKIDLVGDVSLKYFFHPDGFSQTP